MYVYIYVYTQAELKRLYVDTARECFGAVEFLMQYKEDNDTSVNRTIFRPMQRGYGTDHASPETDSDGDGGNAKRNGRKTLWSGLAVWGCA